MSVVAVEHAGAAWRPAKGCQRQRDAVWLLPEGMAGVHAKRMSTTMEGLMAASSRALGKAPRPAFPLEKLPVELALDIFGRLDLLDKLALRQVSRQIGLIASTSSLYSHVEIDRAAIEAHWLAQRRSRPLDIQAPVSAFQVAITLPLALCHISSSVTSLSITLSSHTFPTSTIARALHLGWGQLESLEFDAQGRADPEIDHALASCVAQNEGTLRRLVIRRYSEVAPRPWGARARPILAHGLRFPRLEVLVLNQAYRPAAQPFCVFHPPRNMRILDVGRSNLIHASGARVLLEEVPPQLEYLSLDYWDSVPERELWPALLDMRVVAEDEDGDEAAHEGEPPRLRPNALRTINLRNIDWLTRADIRTLKTHWINVRRAALGGPPRPESVRVEMPAVFPLTPPREVNPANLAKGQHTFGSLVWPALAGLQAATPVPAAGHVQTPHAITADPLDEDADLDIEVLSTAVLEDNSPQALYALVRMLAAGQVLPN